MGGRNKLKIVLVSMCVAVVGGLLLVPFTRTESPFLCLHMKEVGSQRLSVLVSKFAAERGLKLSDSSKDIKPGPGESNLFLQLAGANIDVTVAHLMADPWACFYGNRADQQAASVVKEFSSMLDKEKIRYEQDHRPEVKDEFTLWQQLTGKK